MMVRWYGTAFTNMPDDVKAKAEEIKAAITAGEYFAFTGSTKIPRKVTNLQVKLLTESIQIVCHTM